MRGEVPAPGRGVLAGDLSQFRDVGSKAIELRIYYRIGTIRGHDATLPARRADLRMMCERIERRLGRRDHFDVEALEQRAGTKLGSGETGVDVIEQPVRGFGGQPFADAEHLVERMIEPDARRRSPEKRIVAGEGMPDLARIPFDCSTVMPSDAEILEAHTLAVEHPEYIMIRCDEQ